MSVIEMKHQHCSFFKSVVISLCLHHISVILKGNLGSSPHLSVQVHYHQLICYFNNLLPSSSTFLCKQNLFQFLSALHHLFFYASRTFKQQQLIVSRKTVYTAACGLPSAIFQETASMLDDSNMGDLCPVPVQKLIGSICTLVMDKVKPWRSGVIHSMYPRASLNS